MGRARVATFAAGGHRPRADPVAERDDGDKAIAAGTVPAAGAGIRPRRGRGERAPARPSEGDREARRRIVERLDDVPCQALKAVDLAPGRPPGAEVPLEPVDGGSEGVELLLRRRTLHGLIGAHARAPATAGNALQHRLTPEDGERSRDGVDAPATVPAAELLDRFGQT